MLTLAIDTAGHLCSAAIFDDAGDRVVAEAVEDIARGHAERLVAVADAALGRAGRGYADLGRIAVTVGPGSFTGIRVGVSFARALALALGIDAVGVSTLEAIARGHRAAAGAAPLLAALDARRGEVYAQLFFAAAPGGGPRAMTPRDAAGLAGENAAVLAGSGAALVADAMAREPAAILGTDAAAPIGVVARIGAERRPPFERPAPLYLRGADARPQTGYALARRA